MLLDLKFMAPASRFGIGILIIQMCSIMIIDQNRIFLTAAKGEDQKHNTPAFDHTDSLAYPNIFGDATTSSDEHGGYSDTSSFFDNTNQNWNWDQNQDSSGTSLHQNTAHDSASLNYSYNNDPFGEFNPFATSESEPPQQNSPSLSEQKLSAKAKPAAEQNQQTESEHEGPRRSFARLSMKHKAAEEQHQPVHGDTQGHVEESRTQSFAVRHSQGPPGVESFDNSGNTSTRVHTQQPVHTSGRESMRRPRPHVQAQNPPEEGGPVAPSNARISMPRAHVQPDNTGNTSIRRHQQKVGGPAATGGSESFARPATGGNESFARRRPPSATGGSESFARRRPPSATGGGTSFSMHNLQQPAAEAAVTGPFANVEPIYPATTTGGGTSIARRRPPAAAGGGTSFSMHNPQQPAAEAADPFANINTVPPAAATGGSTSFARPATGGRESSARPATGGGESIARRRPPPATGGGTSFSMQNLQQTVAEAPLIDPYANVDLDDWAQNMGGGGGRNQSQRINSPSGGVLHQKVSYSKPPPPVHNSRPRPPIARNESIGGTRLMPQASIRAQHPQVHYDSSGSPVSASPRASMNRTNIGPPLARPPSPSGNLRPVPRPATPVAGRPSFRPNTSASPHEKYARASQKQMVVHQQMGPRGGQQSFSYGGGSSFNSQAGGAAGYSGSFNRNAIEWHPHSPSGSPGPHAMARPIRPRPPAGFGPPAPPGYGPPAGPIVPRPPGYYGAMVVRPPSAAGAIVPVVSANPMMHGIVDKVPERIKQFEKIQSLDEMTKDEYQKNVIVTTTGKIDNLHFRTNGRSLFDLPQAQKLDAQGNPEPLPEELQQKWFHVYPMTRKQIGDAWDMVEQHGPGVNPATDLSDVLHWVLDQQRRMKTELERPRLELSSISREFSHNKQTRIDDAQMEYAYKSFFQNKADNKDPWTAQLKIWHQKSMRNQEFLVETSKDKNKKFTQKVAMRFMGHEGNVMRNLFIATALTRTSLLQMVMHDSTYGMKGTDCSDLIELLVTMSSDERRKVGLRTKQPYGDDDEEEKEDPLELDYDVADFVNKQKTGRLVDNSYFCKTLRHETDLQISGEKYGAGKIPFMSRVMIGDADRLNAFGHWIVDMCENQRSERFDSTQEEMVDWVEQLDEFLKNLHYTLEIKEMFTRFSYTRLREIFIVYLNVKKKNVYEEIKKVWDRRKHNTKRNAEDHYVQLVNSIVEDVYMGRAYFFARLLDDKFKKLEDDKTGNDFDAFRDITRILLHRGPVDLVEVNNEYRRIEGKRVPGDIDDRLTALIRSYTTKKGPRDAGGDEVATLRLFKNIVEWSLRAENQYAIRTFIAVSHGMNLNKFEEAAAAAAQQAQYQQLEYHQQPVGQLPFYGDPQHGGYGSPNANYQQGGYGAPQPPPPPPYHENDYYGNQQQVVAQGGYGSPSGVQGGGYGDPQQQQYDGTMVPASYEYEYYQDELSGRLYYFDEHGEAHYVEDVDESGQQHQQQQMVPQHYDHHQYHQ